MSCSNFCRSGRSGSAPTLLRYDICAQLAPLNLYGLAGLSAAMVDGLRALTRVRLAPHRSDEAESADRA
jgi:hypothetical protein